MSKLGSKGMIHVSKNPLVLPMGALFQMQSGDSIVFPLDAESLQAEFGDGEYKINQFKVDYHGHGQFQIFAFLEGWEEAGEFLAELE